jgi:drug/metabolite transporter (DMT)-like permease
MLEFLPSIGSLLAYGSMGTVSKKAINAIGRHRAIAYSYMVLVALLLIISALALGPGGLSFPEALIPEYAFQIAIGALGSILAYKALHYGKASVIGPVSQISSVIVLAASIVFLSETPGFFQVSGALLIVGSALVVAMDEGGRFRMEPWMPYLALSILCRAYYYTSIKSFVSALGPLQASLFLEAGIAAFIILFHALRGKDLSLPKPALVAAPAAGAGCLLFAGSVLYSTSVASIGAGLTSAIYSGTPIVNTVLAYFLLHERLDRMKYAAIALMVLGLVMIFV